MKTLQRGRTQPASRRSGSKGLALVVTLLVLGMSVQAVPPPGRGRPQVTVMTRNLYQGADVAKVADPLNPYPIPARVAQAVGMMLDNEFPARALGVAAEIAETQPDLVALQEVTLIRTQTPGDAAVGGTVPATDVMIDHLEILLDALEAEGLSYRVANQVSNFDLEMPMFDPQSATYLTDLRLTDRQVILVRSDLPPGHLRIRNPQSGSFDAMLYLPLADGFIPILRGWCSVDVFVRGSRFRFIAVHPEAFHPYYRVEQIKELIAGPAATRMPVIIAGDMNSDASSETPYDGYAQLLEAGFKDVWVEVGNAPTSGLTWGHNEDLADPDTTFTKRLDMVLYRGHCLRPLAAEVVGEELSDRVPSLFFEDVELWPSDHAGVVATLRLR